MENYFRLVGIVRDASLTEPGDGKPGFLTVTVETVGYGPKSDGRAALTVRFFQDTPAYAEAVEGLVVPLTGQGIALEGTMSGARGAAWLNASAMALTGGAALRVRQRTAA